VFGALTDRVGNLVSELTNKTETALAALHPGFTTTDLLTILNQSIINFPTNSAEIPPIGKTLLQHAAAAFKQLPTGTVIEIAGYTDNTGDPAANVQLSQQRADAVRAALVFGWRGSEHAGGQRLWQRQPDRRQRHAGGALPQSPHRVPGGKAGIAVATPTWG
jgi:hypothetical protein